MASAAADRYELYPWYCADMTRGDCEATLRGRDVNAGAFLVRRSSSQPGWYNMCVNLGGGVIQSWLIKQVRGGNRILACVCVCVCVFVCVCVCVCVCGLMHFLCTLAAVLRLLPHVCMRIFVYVCMCMYFHIGVCIAPSPLSSASCVREMGVDNEWCPRKDGGYEESIAHGCCPLHI